MKLVLVIAVVGFGVIVPAINIGVDRWTRWYIKNPKSYEK